LFAVDPNEQETRAALTSATWEFNNMDLVQAKQAILPLRRKASTRRERWAWYLYDFGNSAYAAVVLLAVYSAYFKQQVVGGAEGSRLWGVSIGIAMLVVAVLSPVLGVLADFTANKKKLLFFFTVLACTFTALLFFVQEGNVFIGMLFFILAEIGYRSAQVFYNALLPDIAGDGDIGRISGRGWALGSFGGIVCLLIVLGLIMTIGGSFIIRISFLITAAFYGLSTFPLFFILRERTVRQPLPEGEYYISFSIKKLWMTFLNARKFKTLLRFLVAFLIFNNGIMMVLDFAAIIGAVLVGMNQQQLIIFMIIVQVTSVIGAYLFGLLADRIGTKTALLISIALMIVAVGSIFLVNSLVTFNLVGALAGFALTGVQSLSRAAIGQLAPKEQSAEFFGLFSVAGQISAFTGPMLYGLLAASLAFAYQRSGFDVHAAEAAGMQTALWVILAFLVAGFVLMAVVKGWPRVQKHAGVQS
jgi:UMF1 family MFS transporter